MGVTPKCFILGRPPKKWFMWFLPPGYLSKDVTGKARAGPNHQNQGPVAVGRAAAGSAVPVVVVIHLGADAWVAFRLCCYASYVKLVSVGTDSAPLVPWLCPGVRN